MVKRYYAHSIEGEGPEKWQLLEEHLSQVADVTELFAECFDARKWGRALGLAHDHGKWRNCWQAYLRKANEITDDFASYYQGHPEHAIIGAQWLYHHSKDVGKFLAYCIAGHHGGLPDWSDGSSPLKKRLEKEFSDIDFDKPPPSLPANLPFQPDPNRMGFQFQMFIRMLFSCLVDADYLDTEIFLEPDKYENRLQYPEIDRLYDRFWKQFDQLRAKADKELHVNQQREKVLQDCLRAANDRSGLFSLTVPTGGGKTLASLAFALKHARIHGKRRIIYVIPFTSIIEQNAAVFRKMLGDDAVLEHHCNFIADESDWKTRLAVENWDAPVIVTTNVQFFNSFYSHRTSTCRKLHNVADSVVVFDEVQAIPVEKLLPCLEIIRELSSGYGVSSILCTATQPAISYSNEFSSGLKDVTEIINDVPSLFSALKRTSEQYCGTLSEHDLAARLAGENQVLCVVNSRQQALDIFASLPDEEGNFHLSALMHPKHRTMVLAEIRDRLASKEKLPCRVVSTQLIEAGVDVDFPCVYRAIAGIDSIAQAAGRCNRNGRSEELCKVYIFSQEGDNGASYFRQAAQSAEKLFDKYNGSLTEPDCVSAYFSDYFWKNQQRMDEDGIVKECLRGQSGNIQFRSIGRFQMIETATLPVIIAFEDEVRRLVDTLPIIKYKGLILRKLQQYSVQIYPYQFEKIKVWLENPLPEVWVLRTPELYSEVTGLLCDPPQGEAFFG